MIAEKTAGILERVRQVKDESFLDAVTDMLDAYLKVQASSHKGVLAESADAFFDPSAHYSSEEITVIEAKDDFLGYDLSGKPVFAEELHTRTEKLLDSVRSGETMGKTIDELREQADEKLAKWASSIK